MPASPLPSAVPPAKAPPNPLGIAIVCTLALGGVKLVAALYSGSSAVLASASDSLADAAVSGLNLLMMRHAAQPPDAGHPYGHGKAEALAGLAQALVLAGLVGGIAWQAGARILAGAAAPPDAGIAVPAMLFSMAGSFGISTFLARAADRTGSLVLRGDAVHYRMDLYTGAAVLVGLGASAFTGDARADAAASLLVCGLMAKDVAGLLRDAVGELMDQPLPDEERQVVERVLDGFVGRIRGWHELRTRRAGPSRFVEVHLVLPDHMRLLEAHGLAHEVEAAIAGALPGLQVLVHVDAEGALDDGPPVAPPPPG